VALNQIGNTPECTCCSFVFIDIARTVLIEVLFIFQSFFVAAVFMYQDFEFLFVMCFLEA